MMMSLHQVARTLTAGTLCIGMLTCGSSRAALQAGASDVPIIQGSNHVFDIDGDGTMDFGFQTTDGSQTNGEVRLGLGPSGIGVFATNAPIAYPIAFSAMDIVDNGSPLHEGAVWLAGNGSPINGTTKFLGVRFNRSGSAHLAWLRVDLTNGDGNGTLIDSYWNTVPESGMIAGSTNDMSQGTIPVVLSISPDGITIIKSETAVFRVQFSEDVTGVDTSNVVIVVGGNETFFSDFTLSMESPSVALVTINGIVGNGTGTLRVDFVDNNSTTAVDDGAILGGPTAGNGNFMGDTAFVSGPITVTSLEDNMTIDGLVTLREAILAAATDSSVDGSSPGLGADRIEFDPALVAEEDGQIDLTTFDAGADNNEFGPTAFLITDDISISGPSGEHGIILSRGIGDAFRFFHVATNGTLSLENLTLTNGEAQGFDGGMVVGGTGGGAAGMGGAVFNQGTLLIQHCTLSENVATGGNGGQRPEYGSDEVGGGGGGVGGPGQTDSNDAIGGLPNPGGHMLATIHGGYGGGGAGGLNANDIGGDGGFGGGGGGSSIHERPVNFAFAMATNAGAGGFGGGGGAGGYAWANFSGDAQGGAGGNGGFGGGGGGGGNGVSNPNSLGGQGGAGGYAGGSGETGLGDEQSDVSRTSGLGGGGAGMGGALFSDGGTMVLANSTLSGNLAQGGSSFNFGTTPGSGGGGGGLGGAIFNYNGMLTLSNCTVAANIVTSGEGATNGSAEAGGIFTLGDSNTAFCVLRNTMLADSVGSTNDFVGLAINSGISDTSGSGNLIETQSGFSGTIVTTSDPLLSSLSDNGGPTLTHAFDGLSPAVDAGDNSFAAGSFDQRGSGFPRELDGDLDGASGVDIGAFEIDFVDYGDAPDTSSGVGVGSIASLVGTNNFRISIMGDDTETNSTVRDDFGIADSPTLAYNASNQEYLVVWRADDDNFPLINSEWEIFGARVNANSGLVTGFQFRISFMGDDGESNASTRTGFFAAEPEVAWDSVNNQYLVVWYGDDDTSPLIDNEREIFGQRLTSQGSLDGPRIRISTNGPPQNTGFLVQNPDVVYNATEQQFLVVWRGEDDTSPVVDNEHEVYAQRINADGTLDGQVIRVSFAGNDSETNATVRDNFFVQEPAVAWNSIDNEYLIVWSGDDDTSPAIDNEFEISGQLLSGLGVPSGSNFRISDMGSSTDTGYRAQKPALSYNAIDNQYLVAWRGNEPDGSFSGSENEIFATILHADGTIAIAQNRVSDMGEDGSTSFFASNVKAAHNPIRNLYLLTWQGDDDIDNKFNIYGQRLDNHGDEIGDNDFLLGFSGNTTNAAFDADGPDVVFNADQNEFMTVFRGEDDTPPLVDRETEVFGQRLLEIDVPNYRTLLSDNGPSHEGRLGLFMGALVDAEANGVPTFTTDGDDLASLDDEDGLPNDVDYLGGFEVTVDVDVVNSTEDDAILYGWIDYDVNGVFETNEHAQITVPAGLINVVTLDFGTAPALATNETYMRLRLSTDSAASNSFGAASDGEVEDYVVTLGPDAGLGTPKVTITTADATVVLAPSNLVVEIQGTATRHIDGNLSWSNAANGAVGTSVAAVEWTISAVPVVVGANLITVVGSNLLNETSTDTVTLTVEEEDCNENLIPDSQDLDVLGSFQNFAGIGGADFTLNGDAVLSNGACMLTPALNSQVGTVIFEPLSTNLVASFEASFDFRIGPGTGARADGMSFSLFDTGTYSTNASFGENGPGANALTVKFDTFKNTGEPSGNFVSVRYNGTEITNTPAPFTLEDAQWHHTDIVFDGNALTLTFIESDGATPVDVLSAVVVPGYIPRESLYGFGARTGGATDEHWVDDVLFRNTSVSNDTNANLIPDDCEFTPFEIWAIDQGLTPGVNDGFLDDPDGDLAFNLYEYGTGTTPTNALSFTPLSISVSGLAAHVTFTRNTDASELTLILEDSDLINTNGWSGIATNQFGLWSPGPEVTETGVRNPVDVSVEIPNIATNSKPRAFRLNIQP